MLEPKQIDNQTFDETLKAVRVTPSAKWEAMNLTGQGSFITPSYVFTPGPAGIGSIQFTGIKGFDPKRLIAVIDIETRRIIFAVATSKGFNYPVDDKTIYLDDDTSDCSSTDRLQIVYDSDKVKPTVLEASGYIKDDAPEKVVMVGGQDEDGKIASLEFDSLGNAKVLAKLFGIEKLASADIQISTLIAISNVVSILANINLQLPPAKGRQTSAESLSVTMSNTESSQALYTTTFIQGVQLGALIGLSKGQATDKASAAITTTTTTSIALPAGNAIAIGVNITAVSGVNPTYDLSLWESADGINYYKIYDFVRMTGVSNSSCPPIQTTGRNYRLVETIGGTTPSFTRAIYRSDYVNNVGLIRQVIDRSINPNAVNSLTQTLAVEGTRKIYMMLSMAGGGAQPTIALEGTEDLNSGWYDLSTNVTGSAGLVVLNTKDFACKFIRARVTMAGVGSTLVSLTLKALS